MYIVMSSALSTGSYQQAVLAGVPSARRVTSTATRGCIRNAGTAAGRITLVVMVRLPPGAAALCRGRA